MPTTTSSTAPLQITSLDSTSAEFWKTLDKLLAWESVSNEAVDNTVKSILKDVKNKGDSEVVSLTNKLDQMNAADINELEIPASRLKQALNSLPEIQKEALSIAADRIQRYHEHQQQNTWTYEDNDGTLLGQKITPLDRVGIYVPGGKAAYPSSVLMSAIPAKVAGVEEIIMTVPTPGGELNELVLAAASVSGVNRVFTIGGAQAVAALAYGTKTIPQVDKIVGPGNIYVATAKRHVFGTVGIDMIAGPSEILIICDGNTNSDWVAMDLFSQAEHDEDAQSILISPDEKFLAEVQSAINKLVGEMDRSSIITESLVNRGAMIKVKDLDEAVSISNYIAPEHLELSVEDPDILLENIKHAGAIFMGRYTSEAIGDYCAGPNHVLPTSRTARFSSPLGVYDFQKRSSIIKCSPDSASKLGKTASILARGEGLTAHARSAEYRIKPK